MPNIPTTLELLPTPKLILHALRFPNPPHTNFSCLTLDLYAQPSLALRFPNTTLNLHAQSLELQALPFPDHNNPCFKSLDQQKNLRT